MQLKKDGWVFKIAYKWQEGSNEKAGKPLSTNICRVFWLFMFSFFVFWPIIIPVTFTLISLFYFWGFWAAQKLNWERNGQQMYKPYDRWPTIHGHRIWPLNFLLLAGYSTWLYYHWPSCLVFTATFIILAIIICAAWFFFSKSEISKLFKAYVISWKEKVCIRVDFV